MLVIFGSDEGFITRLLIEFYNHGFLPSCNFSRKLCNVFEELTYDGSLDLGQDSAALNKLEETVDRTRSSPSSRTLEF